MFQKKTIEKRRFVRNLRSWKTRFTDILCDSLHQVNVSSFQNRNFILKEDQH